MAIPVEGMMSQGGDSRLEAISGQVFELLGKVNLYRSPAAESLVTQAAAGRRFRLELPPLGEEPGEGARYVRLWEDDYPGWLLATDWGKVAVASHEGQAPLVEGRAELEARLPNVLAFVQAALMTPNEYLWGGTVAPHYDCSGLMQAAFASQGLWLPRDAYQQEAFLEALPVTLEALAAGDYWGLVAGDLVFFGPSERATHVGIYIGEGRYIHSSGKAMGRNGIGVDRLTADAGAPAVSRGYFEMFRGAGRVVQSYRSGQPFPAYKP